MKKLLIILLFLVSSFGFGETYGQSKNRYIRQLNTTEVLNQRILEILNLVNKSNGKTRYDATILLIDQISYMIGYLRGMQGLAESLFDYYGNEVYLSSSMDLENMSNEWLKFLIDYGYDANTEKVHQGISVALLGYP